ncbi:MAG TPA: hypothetical protein PLZ77_03240, partial [Lachnospiraceae bacterium]|nr:hypothetical protein [Lachnospiraceae bacterium]
MRKTRFLISWIMVVLLCSACTVNRPNTVSGASIDTGFVAAVPGNYDSADTAVLISRDMEAMTMCFLNLELGRQYTLCYDGATTFADKYGQGMSLEQVQDGDVVNVTFMKDRKRLNSLQLSADAFVMPQVENFTIAANDRTVILNGEEYTCSKDLVVLSDQGVGELMDVNSVDVLRICGSDHTIYS